MSKIETVPRELILHLRPNFQGKTSSFDFNRLTEREQQYVLRWKEERRRKFYEARREIRRSSYSQNVKMEPKRSDANIDNGTQDIDENAPNFRVTSQEQAMRLFRRAQNECMATMKREIRGEAHSSPIDCLACIFERRGETVIFGGPTHSCKIDVPDGRHELEEHDEHLRTVEPPAVDDMAYIAVQLRAITKSSELSLKNSSAIRVSQMSSNQRDPEHVVVFAPSGSGKTYAQKKLFEKGIITVDTDLILQPTSEDIHELLEVTSVFTNRADLITSDMRVLAFTPDYNTFKGRMKKKRFTKKKDIEKWYGEMEFPHVENLTRVRIKKSYVSQWFEVEGKDVKLSMRDKPRKEIMASMARIGKPELKGLLREPVAPDGTTLRLRTLPSGNCQKHKSC